MKLGNGCSKLDQWGNSIQGAACLLERGLGRERDIEGSRNVRNNEQVVKAVQEQERADLLTGGVQMPTDDNKADLLH